MSVCLSGLPGLLVLMLLVNQQHWPKDGSHGKRNLNYMLQPRGLAISNEEAEKQGSNRDFYVFNADDANKGNVLKLRIEDKIINIIIDSGASCNLISEQVFNQIAGGKVDLSACDKKVFAYAQLSQLS